MRRFAVAGLALAAALGLPPPAARAVGPFDVPPVGRTEPIRSLLVTSPGAPVVLSPAADAPKRGSLAGGERVPYMGDATGPGCVGPFYRVDPEGYVCSRYVEPSSAPPRAAPHPAAPAAGELLPWSYGYARGDGARVYRRVDDVESESWDTELDPGFGIGVRRTRVVLGERFHETLGGHLIPASDLRLARPPAFHGVALSSAEEATGTAWVIDREVHARSRPGGGERTVLFSHHDRLRIEETVLRGGRTFLRVGERAWLDARSVRRVRLSARPENVGADERWVDVDLDEQIATAYEGDRPVYATLVSTGRRGVPTPTGLFRIWVKLERSLMDNVEDEEAESFYSLDDVPWVLYFERGVALHAAFWHDRFGERHSHGCVNLAPVDARFFYDFAGPRLPDGWTAVFPTDRTPGTLVRVH